MYKPYTLKDVYDASAQEKFKVISTFAGGGGSSTGYRLAGGKVLVINEFVEEAQKTYAENYPDTVILPGDIKELNGKDFLDAAGVGVGEIDILDGSPPCSAFSVAGKLSHNIHEEEHLDVWGDSYIEKVTGKHSDGWGQTKNYSDGKTVENIEDLFFEFLRVANEIKPKVIVAENVKGLTIGEAKEYFNKILNTFEKIGYEVCARCWTVGIMVYLKQEPVLSLLVCVRILQRSLVIILQTYLRFFLSQIEMLFLLRMLWLVWNMIQKK
jgi:DNA (cytosine-5)-methyltransferase 1